MFLGDMTAFLGVFALLFYLTLAILVAITLISAILYFNSGIKRNNAELERLRQVETHHQP